MKSILSLVCFLCLAGAVVANPPQRPQQQPQQQVQQPQQVQRTVVRRTVVYQAPVIQPVYQAPIVQPVVTAPVVAAPVVRPVLLPRRTLLGNLLFGPRVAYLPY